jgi:hypothetical protein
LVEDGICRACRNKTIRECKECIGGAAIIVDLSISNDIDPLTSLASTRNETRDVLKDKLNEFYGLKWFLSVVTAMYKTNSLGEEIDMETSFCGETETMLLDDEFEEQFDSQIDTIMRRLKDFVREGSGWSVRSVNDIKLHLVAYVPTSGSSYLKTPQYVASKKAVINVQNLHDEKCFLWSILAALHPADDRHVERLSKYEQFETELDATGLILPLAVKDVKKFEKLNRKISVNVLAYDGKKTFYPVYVTSEKGREHTINLLLLEKDGNCHYVWIKNMSRLLHKPKYHQRYYCFYCLHGFCKQSSLDRHVEDCSKFGLQKIVLPDERDKWVEFRAIERMLNVPFVIYADFESYTTKLHNATKKSGMEPYQLHVPSGFAYLIVSSDSNRKYAPVLYRGPDVVERFLQCMKQESEAINSILSNPLPINISRDEEELFRLANRCYLCDKPLLNDRVRDHDHLTGRYRGAAHSACNLKLHFQVKDKRQSQFFIPVIFHNLRGYDGHLILKGYKRGIFDKGNVNCIPNNMERYLSFSIDNLRFIDSYQFMSESLEKLASNLNFDDFHQTKRVWPNDKVHLLLRKGVYPYDYMDCPDRMKETKLPPREAFYSRLTDEEVSCENYEHACRVWTEFDMKNMGDYHDTYLTTDVTILADVFENFRTTCMKQYGLDPAHYYSSPGLAWDAMLKMTKIRLELMLTREMHDVVDKGIRGGMCCISHKYAKANNPYISDSYDPTKESSYIIYYDMNNLYGTAMVESLPEKDFRFESDDATASFDFESVPDDGTIGHILEVDLDYPNELHDKHSDYPLCPESLTVTAEELSPYTKSLMNKLAIKGPTKNCRKLISNLGGKRRYVLHYRNLKQYVKLGMVVTKIHRVLTFRQSKWLKPYIDFNTEQRKKAVNEFEKNFFKLMNNSVFGKTIENVRKRQDVKLVTDGRKLKRLTSRPCFKSFKIFNKDLMAVHSNKTEIKLEKPTYVGLSILDLSKLFMFSFHYEYIVPKYEKRAKLLMTDTDSLIYYVETPDIYADMLSDIDNFDTSDYPSDHTAYSVANKKKLGKMKDEYCGRLIREFVGLKLKMYSILDIENNEKKTAKGISKRVSAKKIRHESYKEVLFNESTTTTDMQLIRSIEHEVFTVSLMKTALSPYDDKR